MFKGSNVELIGNIDLTGMGFIGGEVKYARLANNNDYSDYYVLDERFGGRKGEGITKTKYPYLYGRGKWSNAGGGGNSVNGGGGGGGNGGEGGFGGTWIDREKYTRGIGGQKLDGDGRRLFFGGGGGAGHDNNRRGTSGARGGGICVVLCDTLKSNYNIAVMNNGDSALVGGIDASGGGGGGGSTLVLSDITDSSISWACEGGQGGDNHTDYHSEGTCHGPGGGGGGGVIIYNGIQGTMSVKGGRNGVILNNATHPLCQGKPLSQYATPGEDGSIYLANESFLSDVKVNLPKFKYITTNHLCDGMLKVTVNRRMYESTVKVKVNGVELYDSLIFQNKGYIFIELIDSCFIKDTIFKIEPYNPINIELINVTNINCFHLGKIVVEGHDGVPKYKFKINNDQWQNFGIFENLPAGEYLVTVEDSLGCQDTLSVNILEQESQIKIYIDTSDLIMECGDSTNFIEIIAQGTFSNYLYSLDGLGFNNISRFANLPIGKHYVIVKDEFGCNADTTYFEIIERDFFVRYDHRVVCNEDTVYINGSVYYTDTLIIDTLSSHTTCDSVKVTDLKFKHQVLTINQTVICQGDSVEVGKSVYYSEGIYKDTLQTKSICDSIVITEITFFPRQDTYIDTTLCQGDVYRVGSHQYRC